MANTQLVANNNGNAVQPMGDNGVVQATDSKGIINNNNNNNRNGKGDAANVQGHFLSEVRIKEEFEPYQEEGDDSIVLGANGASPCLGWADLVSRGYCPQNLAISFRCPTCTSPSCATCRGICAEPRPDGYPPSKPPPEPEQRRVCRLICSCAEDHCPLIPQGECATKPVQQQWPCPRCRDPTPKLTRAPLGPSCCQPPPQKTEHFPEYTPQTLRLLYCLRGPESSRPILQRDLRCPPRNFCNPCYPYYPCYPCYPSCYGCNPRLSGGELCTTTRTKFYKEPTCPINPNCYTSCPQLIGEEEVCTVRRQIPHEPCGVPCCSTPCGPCPAPCTPSCSPCLAPCVPPCGPYPAPCSPRCTPSPPCSPCPSPCA